MSVATLIDQSRTRTDDFKTLAEDAMRTTNDQIKQWGFYVPKEVFVDDPNDVRDDIAVPDKVLSSSYLSIPVFNEGIGLELPTPELGAPDKFQDISPIDKGKGAPTFDEVAPTYNQPNKPSQLSQFTHGAPAINLDAAFPSAPAQLLAPIAEMPVIIERVAPVAPQTIIPAFTAASPDNTISAPGNLAANFDSAYRGASPSIVSMANGYVDAQLSKINPRYHEQMERIETQLATYLDGGTGLKPAVENAIYERARGKNDAEARRVRDASFADAAARGFTLPNGAMMASIRGARQAGADNNARAASEIVVMQAEMEQKNLQFAVTTSAGLRTAVVNATLSYMQNILSANGQALDYAKNIVNSEVEVFNITAKVFSSRLDAYRAEAAVYETRMKGAMMGVELYKAEIDALSSLSNLDKVKIEAFKAKMDTYSMLAGVYKTQVETVVSKASLERLKIDLYQAQVQAHGQEVQAKNAEWQAYQAEIEGEMGKFKAFQSQVDAFRAKSQAYQSFIETQAANNKSEAMGNEARAANFSAQAQAYTVHLEANKSKMNGLFQIEAGKLTAYQAKVKLAEASSMENFRYYEMQRNTRSENAQLKVTWQKMRMDSERSFRETVAKIGTDNAHIYGTLASSAMSGINTLASELKYE